MFGFSFPYQTPVKDGFVFQPTNIADFGDAVKPRALNFAISVEKSFHLLCDGFGRVCRSLGEIFFP